MYGIQMLADKDAGPFWRHLGETTQGKHIQLGKYHSLIDIAVRAICLRETEQKETKLKVGSIVISYITSFTQSVDISQAFTTVN